MRLTFARGARRGRASPRGSGACRVARAGRAARRHLHDRERGSRADLEAGCDVGTLVDVDLLDREMLAFLPRDVRDQALHSPRRARAVGGEEDEDCSGVALHRESPVERRNPTDGYVITLIPLWAPGTGSAS